MKVGWWDQKEGVRVEGMGGGGAGEDGEEGGFLWQHVPDVRASGMRMIGGVRRELDVGMQVRHEANPRCGSDRYRCIAFL